MAGNYEIIMSAGNKSNNLKMKIFYKTQEEIRDKMSESFQRRHWIIFNGVSQ